MNEEIEKVEEAIPVPRIPGGKKFAKLYTRARQKQINTIENGNVLEHLDGRRYLVTERGYKRI